MIRATKAFTLIELILSMTIVSIALTGTLLVFNTTVRHSADPMIIHQMSAVAQSYLEEILAKRFPVSLPCPIPPAERSLYANVCDYHNLTDNGPEDQSGNQITGLSNYTVQVNVDTTGAILDSLMAGTEVVRVDVTVSHPAAQPLTLSGYRANY